MTTVRRTCWWAAALGLAGSAVIYGFFGLGATVGWVAGVGLATASILSFVLVGSLAAAQAEAPRPIHGLTFVLFLFKLPIFWLVIEGVRRLGPDATTCFLMGLGLVYSSLVLGALFDRRCETEG
jgi:hypothetical protein